MTGIKTMQEIGKIAKMKVYADKERKFFRLDDGEILSRNGFIRGVLPYFNKDEVNLNLEKK